MAVYFVDPHSRRLVGAPTAGSLELGMEVYGSCLYRSAANGEYYAFFNSKEGTVQQWRLSSTEDATVSAELVRTFSVNTQTEGCVADDELGRFYLGEEARGIWRFGAEPDAPPKRTLIDTTDENGHLTADVEGLAIFYGPNGAGYVIASSQGSDSFAIYERCGGNAYVLTVAIAEGNGIDGVTGTDGIDVISTRLGAHFPGGLFVAQDDENGSDTQNFKLVSWPAIAELTTPPLAANPAWNPRAFANR
jgi:3-phytase